MTLTFASKENEEIHIKNNANRKAGEYDLKFKYVEDASSIEVCSKILHVFFTNLNKQLKNKNYNLFYLGVPEFQRNGNINNCLGLKTWRYGKSYVELIVDKSRITTYISKYMIKSFDEISDTIYLERLNKQRYYKSNNLIKPKLLTEEEYDLIKEEVESSYISYYKYVSHNPYTDNTTIKKVYQLNDI